MWVVEKDYAQAVAMVDKLVSLLAARTAVPMDWQKAVL